MAASHLGQNRLDRAFTAFANLVARRTGSQWSMLITAGLVLVSLAIAGIAATNLLISIVTLLMGSFFRTTQSRDSAAIHLKLDEIVKVEPAARDTIRGTEQRSSSRSRSPRRTGPPTVRHG